MSLDRRIAEQTVGGFNFSCFLLEAQENRHGTRAPRASLRTFKSIQMRKPLNTSAPATSRNEHVSSCHEQQEDDIVAPRELLAKSSQRTTENHFFGSVRSHFQTPILVIWGESSGEKHRPLSRTPTPSSREEAPGVPEARRFNCTVTQVQKRSPSCLACEA